MYNSTRISLFAGCAAIALGAANPALAQVSVDPDVATEEAPVTGGLNDIVVTARKREESVQTVPVAVSAYDEALIEQRDITSIEKIAAIAPNFNVGRASNGSGAQLTLRGIGSSSTSIGIEQSVAVVVDGAYYGQGRIINEGFFDLARVEVLKGPQALFFGKNATAGVISITTADPGPEPEVLLRAGYEFQAEQYHFEGIASLPFNDRGGIRLALRYTKMNGGYYTNIADPVNYTTLDVIDLGGGGDGNPMQHTAFPAVREAPQEDELLGRITLKSELSDRLTVTLKGSLDINQNRNNSWNYVAYRCGNGTGISQLTPYACERDFVTHQNNIPLDIAANFPFAKEDGELYNDYRSYAFTANAVYQADSFQLTSVTNYQDNNNQWACACDFQSSDNGTWATENSDWRAFSQELRLLTELDGPFNVMLGGLYQSTRRDFEQYVMFAGLRNSLASPQNEFLASSKLSYTDGETLAAFGQATFEITPTLELAGGARYTHETKDSFFTQPYNNPGLTFIFRDQNDPDGMGIVTAEQTFNNWSPEATITWTPTDDLLVYGAYKTAYKSGGFSNGGINSKFSANPSDDLTFEPEEAEGFEVGVKATVLDNQLRLNLIGFRYDYNDLQIDFFNSPIFAFQTLTADARTQGFEFEFEYAPYSLAGLNVRGSLNYTDAEYTDFPQAPCYAGQTISEGCQLVNAIDARQNLNGVALSVAPKWTATLGAAYDTYVGNDYELGLSIDARYSDDYNPSAFGNPLAVQDSYITLDAGVRFGREDGKWELAVIGKNLTNEFYVTGVVDGPSTGAGTGTTMGTRADQLGFGNLPRTVKVQVTTRF